MERHEFEKSKDPQTVLLAIPGSLVIGFFGSLVFCFAFMLLASLVLQQFPRDLGRTADTWLVPWVCLVGVLCGLGAATIHFKTHLGDFLNYNVIVSDDGVTLNRAGKRHYLRWDEIDSISEYDPTGDTTPGPSCLAFRGRSGHFVVKEDRIKGYPKLCEILYARLPSKTKLMK